MEIRTSNNYRITFEDLKEKFPEIKGDLIEMNFEDKTKTLIVDTTTAYYEDEKVIIHKEIVLNPKDKFIIKDKATGVTAEGSTEVEAKNKLNEMIKVYTEEIKET